MNKNIMFMPSNFGNPLPNKEYAEEAKHLFDTVGKIIEEHGVTFVDMNGEPLFKSKELNE